MEPCWDRRLPAPSAQGHAIDAIHTALTGQTWPVIGHGRNPATIVAGHALAATWTDAPAGTVASCLSTPPCSLPIEVYAEMARPRTLAVCVHSMNARRWRQITRGLITCPVTVDGVPLGRSGAGGCDLDRRKRLRRWPALSHLRKKS